MPSSSLPQCKRWTPRKSPTQRAKVYSNNTSSVLGTHCKLVFGVIKIFPRVSLYFPAVIFRYRLWATSKRLAQTTEQLADAISKSLDSFVRQPSVTVSVLSAVSAEYLQRVRITGAVNNPLSIPYRRGLTVLDFVLQAGGLTPFANADRALLYRQVGEALNVYPVRLDDILAKGDLETNYALLPSDIITVPENSF